MAAIPAGLLSAAEPLADATLPEYFRREVTQIHAQTFAGVQTSDDWTRQREANRAELREMLGLAPLPDKTDLHAVVTGREERDELYVEKLHFQSMPGLYVTASLYVPKHRTGRVPAILYVCGHHNAEAGGVSYGAKARYQHHGAWLARNGYVCLLLDTVQMGELQGEHYGTARNGKWWWNSRGYTPAGVETWNSIRALDYLESRPEVDGAKLGMTGRSGGGAYTWWTAALDDRVKVAAPVSGMTDLWNHVVDGCVARHCDCMYPVNTGRWDFAKAAALVAPRPLLLANGDRENLFPLDGILRLHADLASIYRLYHADTDLGLLIVPGPHKDSQDLQIPVLRWFNHYFKGDDPLIRSPAESLFSPQELKVFAQPPADQRTTTIQETFVPMAIPPVPADANAWQRQRQAWIRDLREKSFAGWPDSAVPFQPVQADMKKRGAVTLSRWEFTAQEEVRLPLFVFSRGDPRNAGRLRLHVVDEQGWSDLLAALGDEWRPDLASPGRKPGPGPTPAGIADFRSLYGQIERGETAVAILAPRGIGPTAWGTSDKDRTEIRRRFMLVGQTLDGMRVWDIRRAVELLRQPEVAGALPICLAGERDEAVNALYASLFSDGVAALEMIAPPSSHRMGPDYLNVQRFLDVPQAVALAAERNPVKILQGKADDWAWVRQAANRLGWPADRLQW
ncbi:MAG: acetylxylan esterase [Opitutae bacterium]|nr:acetylxylan esterase [Opitutae bacterium]